MKFFITSFLAFLFSTSIYSATVIVTNTSDSGAGSLREAVTNASSGDIVKIDPALLASGSDTIHVLSTIDITTGLTIEGTFNAADTLFISGGDSVQIFHFYTPSAGAIYNVILDSLVLTRGSGVYGGAIHVDYDYSVAFGVSAAPGIMTFQNCTFMNNSANYGGAVGTWRVASSGNRTASVNYRIYGCTFKNNVASASGGALGIRLSSSVTTQGAIADIDIDSSSFIGNSANADGGAIYTYGWHNAPWNINPNATSGIDLSISRSTISENTSGSEGGGIYCNFQDNSTDDDAYTNVYIEYSTLSDNSAVSDGGAVYAYAEDDAEIEIRFSSIVYNTAFNEGSGFYNECLYDKANFDLFSSIFAMNSNGVGTNNNIFNDGPGNNSTSKFSRGHNIFDNTSTWIVYNPGGPQDYFAVSEVSLNLEPLALNNNNTYTRAPGASSFAIDLGPATYTDPAQNVALVGNRDIGAAESTVCTFVTITTAETICAGNAYTFNGQVLTTAGMYADTVTDPVECDTIFNLTLTVDPLVAPVATISANPGSTIMTGTSVTFTASVINGGSIPSYQWKLNGTNVGFNSSSYTNGALTDTDVVICEVTSSAQCVTIPADDSNPITMIVHVNNDEPCSAIPVAVGSICTFSYFTNDAATSTSGVADHNCSNDSGHDVWFQFIAPPSGVTELETLAGTLTDAVTSIYEGSCSSLFEIGCIDDVGTDKMPYGTFYGGVPGETYYLRVSGWSTLSGSFALCLYEGSGVGISETQQNGFKIYPNPSRGIVNFEFKQNEKRTIQIHNTAGQIVLSEVQTGSKGSIDCSSLASGIYQVWTISEKGTKLRQQLVISN